MKLESSVILITGAARGLGAAMARSVAARGATPVLVDLDEASLGNTRQACQASGVKVGCYAADVSREAEVERLFERVVRDFGRLDALINNAGILCDGLLVKAREGEIVDKLSLEQWQAVIDVNLTGVFLCGREAAAQMIRLNSRGCIINMSSVSRAGNFGQSNYSASKAGGRSIDRGLGQGIGTVRHSSQRHRSRVRQNGNGRQHEAGGSGENRCGNSGRPTLRTGRDRPHGTLPAGERLHERPRAGNRWCGASVAPRRRAIPAPTEARLPTLARKKTAAPKGCGNQWTISDNDYSGASTNSG